MDEFMFEFEKALSSVANNEANFDVDVNIDKEVDKTTTILQAVDLTGNSAILFADVEALGEATEVEVDTSILTIAGELSSISVFAESAANGGNGERRDGAVAWSNGTSDAETLFEDITDGNTSFEVTFGPLSVDDTSIDAVTGLFGDLLSSPDFQDVTSNTVNFTLSNSSPDTGDTATLDEDLAFTFVESGIVITLNAGAEFAIDANGAIEFTLIEASFDIVGGTADIPDIGNDVALDAFALNFDTNGEVSTYDALASVESVPV
ncbi:MAG: hypothetical protein AAGB13_07200 [Cyanobacteria bacterium P01_F01_bin.33]